MFTHPGNELGELIGGLGFTQRAFAKKIGKRVSELNELIKGRRNITIQRDILLAKVLDTPQKYWVLKQLDYDYSLALEKESDGQQDQIYGVGGDLNEKKGGSDLDDKQKIFINF